MEVCRGMLDSHSSDCRSVAERHPPEQVRGELTPEEAGRLP